MWWWLVLYELGMVWKTRFVKCRTEYTVKSVNDLLNVRWFHRLIWLWNTGKQQRHFVWDLKVWSYFAGINKWLLLANDRFLPPANEVCEGYVFTGVCLSTPGGGMHGFIRGACVVLFGGHAWFYSGGVGRAWFFSDTMRYGQWAGGTHPTGMHSCTVSMFVNFYCVLK